MTVKVTFEFETNADAATFLQGLDDGPAATGAEAGEQKRGRGRPKKVDAPAPAAPAAAPAAVASAAPAAAPAAPPPSTGSVLVPFDKLVEPLTELAELDHPAATAILAGHGVKKASELKPDQIGAVLAAVQAKLGELKAPVKQSLI